MITLVLSALVLSACEIPDIGGLNSAPATAASTVTEAPTATDVPVTQIVSTNTPVARNFDPVVTADANQQINATAEALDCSLTGGSVQLKLTLVEGKWQLDLDNLVPVEGYNGDQDISQLGQCEILLEGEDVQIVNRDGKTTKTHGIWHLQKLGERSSMYLDGSAFDCLFGCSAYAFPVTWNMDDFSTVKPPVMAEFQGERDDNQTDQNYDWPDVFHFADGTSGVVYESSPNTAATIADCKDLTAPKPVNVAGAPYEGDKFNASIGGQGCWVAVKIDGAWDHWFNAKDNVVYTTIEAVLFPASATEQDVIDYIAAQ